MSWKPPGSDVVRWRRRLIRSVDLLTAAPRFRRLDSARTVVRGSDLPDDRDAAVGAVGDYCFDRGLCYSGTVRFVEQTFELDRPTTLRLLAGNGRSSVAAKVAADPDLHPSLAAGLSRSAARSVREQVAGNHSAPTEVVERLLHDPDQAVARRAAWNLAAR